jgi:hypothetical protein
MLLMPKYWLVWIAVLIAVNMIGPLSIIKSIEAQVVLSVAVIGGIIQMLIFKAKGFVRLLGLGHFLWIPMVPWLFSRLEGAAPETPFYYWILMVICLNSLSIIIDVTDVIRYILGERAPQLKLKD